MKLDKYKWNRLYVGLLLGLVIPAITFVIVYFIGFNELDYAEYFGFILVAKILPKILCLCVIPNLIAFHIFLKKQYYKLVYGVIFATLIYTLIVVVLKFI